MFTRAELQVVKEHFIHSCREIHSGNVETQLGEKANQSGAVGAQLAVTAAERFSAKCFMFVSVQRCEKMIILIKVVFLFN